MRYFLKGIFIFLIALNCMAKELSNLRNVRYCEVLVIHGITSIEIYSTIGLNECPNNIWQHLDTESLKKKLNVYDVMLNGPRYWVLDKIETNAILEPKFISLSGLRLKLVAHLKNVLFVLLKNKKPYHEVEVARQTVWIYEANKPVYELISPDGAIYIMQSYSVHKDEHQTLDSLSLLGHKLKLPKSWVFKTGILLKEERIPTKNDKAIVIQDDFENTYQRIDRDVLN